ncbi:metallo-beta-lactamase class B [Catalinimonas alkaloidigena]|uniref:subclass B1 metallo-beta-lactamase n=1 Tax=Catalinimonas alkaloidigena TaxID=1075417 RepID=UPI002405648A|nr:subclass B1 metallo-beta-lactamase [Catalinimonas alkaloidigena]MDF9795037.1 metallo-beta-lactamase class B [Catalinimonas alkaloidigena]
MRKLSVITLLFIAILTFQARGQAEKIHISEDLEIIPLTDKSFIHVSYVTYPSFGRVACNGLLYVNGNEAVVMDTPPNDEISGQLLDWISQKFPETKVTSVVINHFHSDCLGGLGAFHEAGATSYASRLTCSLAGQDNAVVPQNSFARKKKIKVGDQEVVCRFLGEAHTRDNIVTWLPEEEILFGGCMVKSVNATKGNLEDANVDEWASTISKVKRKYKEAKTIIPGHGDAGGVELLDYTMQLFAL